MIYDCAIVGGGAAGLSAALVLGRARRSVALLDNSQPRNAVTRESHGFLTRDGVTPSEFRHIAYAEVLSYPSVEHHAARVTDIRKLEAGFRIVMDNGVTIQARKLLMASGLREVLPSIPGIAEFYGKSLFNCPYCDGWELRDQPLILLAEQPRVYHAAKLLYHWSPDLVVCTNGSNVLTDEEKQVLTSRNIQVTDEKVAAFHGTKGKLEQVEFADGSRIERTGGFIAPQLLPQTDFRESLGYEMTEADGISTDATGKSTVPGLYAAGEAASGASMNLILAAAAGSMAAMSINVELMEEEFSS
ncbi:NAD(P)/FAD-dependent oxidoreductase [Paenibacillus sp. P96]|uniref:NAD(P)/FAD-dependent oxidoreductase n=1 Tax=Paenibacillus zeirhizosphaerae TaxID=2987519 RepID=A0ABT9FUA2_9BACL|nr:NAD(P)/FAD-dependent oxidoreductase [Paenibacillus sp. P96]MDP4098314.1 NAD(P)/FAD-dependent oxidoreductase [Paenibacillus sp. P96]